MFFIDKNGAAVNSQHQCLRNRRRITELNSSPTAAKRRGKQRGFSSLEILIATILIGLLIAGGVYYANIGDKVDAVNMASIQTAAVVRFPEAIMTIYAQTNRLTSVSKNDLIGTHSVVNNKPLAWIVMATGAHRANKDEISIKFSFPNNTQTRGFLDYLNAHINTTMVKSAASADNGRAAIVRYSVSNV